jgi:hypothetical protein
MGVPELMIILLIITPLAGLSYYVFYIKKRRLKNFKIEDELNKLDELKKENLINDEEYNKKKEKLLQEL